MQIICKLYSASMLSHVRCFTAFMRRESSDSLWQSDEENREAGRQNRDSDTETDEYKEKDKHQRIQTEGGWRVYKCIQRARAQRRKKERRLIEERRRRVTETCCIPSIMLCLSGLGWMHMRVERRSIRFKKWRRGYTWVFADSNIVWKVHLHFEIK